MFSRCPPHTGLRPRRIPSVTLNAMNEPGRTIFAFFRDKASDGMDSDGLIYQPAGIITDKYGSGCPSGKDYVVAFIDPVTLRIQRQWRSESEIEILPVEEWQWRDAGARFRAIESMR